MKKPETESSILTSARHMHSTLDSSILDLNSSVRENLKFELGHASPAEYRNSSMLIRDALEDEVDIANANVHILRVKVESFVSTSRP